MVGTEVAKITKRLETVDLMIDGMGSALTGISVMRALGTRKEVLEKIEERYGTDHLFVELDFARPNGTIENVCVAISHIFVIGKETVNDYFPDAEYFGHDGSSPPEAPHPPLPEGVIPKLGGGTLGKTEQAPELGSAPGDADEEAARRQAEADAEATGD